MTIISGLQKIEADKVLIEKVRTLIETAKYEVAVTVNSSMTLLYWEIGAYVNSFILDNKRAEYGKQIVVSQSRQLTWTHIIALIPIEDELKRNFYIRVAEYMTRLPSRNVLEDKLQQAIERAKYRLANSGNTNS